MLKASFYILLATIFSLTFAGATRAGEGEATARQGVVRCIGNNFLRLGDTEIQFTSWTLHNFDSTNPIVIERVRIFNSRGEILGDSAAPGSSLPDSDNGLLGSANN